MKTYNIGQVTDDLDPRTHMTSDLISDNAEAYFSSDPVCYDGFVGVSFLRYHKA